MKHPDIFLLKCICDITLDLWVLTHKSKTSNAFIDDCSKEMQIIIGDALSKPKELIRANILIRQLVKVLASSYQYRVAEITGLTCIDIEGRVPDISIYNHSDIIGVETNVICSHTEASDETVPTHVIDMSSIDAENEEVRRQKYANFIEATNEKLKNVADKVSKMLKD